MIPAAKQSVEYRLSILTFSGGSTRSVWMNAKHALPIMFSQRCFIEIRRIQTVIMKICCLKNDRWHHRTGCSIRSVLWSSGQEFLWKDRTGTNGYETCAELRIRLNEFLESCCLHDTSVKHNQTTHERFLPNQIFDSCFREKKSRRKNYFKCNYPRDPWKVWWDRWTCQTDYATWQKWCHNLSTTLICRKQRLCHTCSTATTWTQNSAHDQLVVPREDKT